MWVRCMANSILKRQATAPSGTGPGLCSRHPDRGLSPHPSRLHSLEERNSFHRCALYLYLSGLRHRPDCSGHSRILLYGRAGHHSAADSNRWSGLHDHGQHDRSDRGAANFAPGKGHSSGVPKPTDHGRLDSFRETLRRKMEEVRWTSDWPNRRIRKSTNDQGKVRIGRVGWG